MKIRHEVTVGALTILGIVLMILGYNYLKGNEIFSKNYFYKINFPNTTGLYPANSVVINGLEVGRVKEIKLSEDLNHQIIVTISLPKALAIPEDSKFTIESLDLLGKKAISIVRGTNPTLLSEEKIYQGNVPKDMISALSEQLEPVAEKANKLMTSLDTMLNDVHNALGKGENSALKKTMDNVTATLVNANKLLAEVSGIFAQQKGSIESLIKNADGVMTNTNQITKKIADNSQSIDNILKNFETLSQKVSQADIENTINSAKTTLEEVSTLLSAINEGQGTLGKIAKDENLYHSIDSTINSLNALLIDFKKNPKRYVSLSLIERRNKE